MLFHGGGVNVELGLSNYAAKSDLKHATFAKESWFKKLKIWSW